MHPFNIDSHNSFDKLLHALSRVEYNLNTYHIDSFLDYIDKALTKDFANLENKIKEEEKKGNSEYASYLEGCQSYIPDTHFLAHELSIVALYKEIETKASLLFKKNMTSKYPKKFYLDKKNIKANFKIDLEDIPEYDSFNELRLINNSIKHYGYVNNDLSINFKRWGNEGDELNDLKEAYERLKPEVITFFNKLFDLVYEKKENVKQTDT